jgi:hypothetical protein
VPRQFPGGVLVAGVGTGAQLVQVAAVGQQSRQLPRGVPGVGAGRARHRVARRTCCLSPDRTLKRGLKTAPGHLCIEASTAWQRGRGPARTISQARSDPKSLLDETGHELRSFTLWLSSNAGPARGHGHGSFVNSVLAAVETFYTDVVQHIKPWNPAPPKVREGEPPLTDEPVPGEAAGQGPDDMDPVTDGAAPAEISGTRLPHEYATSL